MLPAALAHLRHAALTAGQANNGLGEPAALSCQGPAVKRGADSAADEVAAALRDPLLAFVCGRRNRAAGSRASRELVLHCLGARRKGPRASHCGLRW